MHRNPLRSVGRKKKVKKLLDNVDISCTLSGTMQGLVLCRVPKSESMLNNNKKKFKLIPLLKFKITARNGRINFFKTEYLRWRLFKELQIAFMFSVLASQCEWGISFKPFDYPDRF